jgi:hypothetical protein
MVRDHEKAAKRAKTPADLAGASGDGVSTDTTGGEFESKPKDGAILGEIPMHRAAQLLCCKGAQCGGITPWRC